MIICFYTKIYLAKIGNIIREYLWTEFLKEWMSSNYIKITLTCNIDLNKD